MTSLQNRVLFTVLLFTLINCSEDDFDLYVPKPYYADEYKEEYRDQISFEMNPLVVLTQSIISYTNSFRIDSDSDYYKILDANLSNHKEHSVISLYGSLNNNLGTYLRNTAGSFGYTLNQDNSISEYTTHKFNSLPNTNINDFLARKNAVEDFAKKVNFYSIWTSISSQNNEIIASYQELIDIEDMKSWLENRFELRFDTYRIIISPLSRTHSVIYNRTKDFNELVAFVGPTPIDSTTNTIINSGFATRIVFTEINHPYVDQFSSKYFEPEIKRLFTDANKWGNGAFGDYSPGGEIFSEYMTWALFCMYAKDTYTDDIAQELIESVNVTMENARKFRLFREFTDELFKEFSSFEDMHSIYEHMLSWAENQ